MHYQIEWWYRKTARQSLLITSKCRFTIYSLAHSFLRNQASNHVLPGLLIALCLHDRRLLLIGICTALDQHHGVFGRRHDQSRFWNDEEIGEHRRVRPKIVIEYPGEQSPLWVGAMLVQIPSSHKQHFSIIISIMSIMSIILIMSIMSIISYA